MKTKTIFKHEHNHPKTSLEIAVDKEIVYFKFFTKEIKPEYLFKDYWWEALDLLDELINVASYILITNQLTKEKEKELKNIFSDYLNIDPELLWEEGIARHIALLKEAKVLKQKEDHTVYEYRNQYYIKLRGGEMYEATKEELAKYL
jgi:hypothetical protein